MNKTDLLNLLKEFDIKDFDETKIDTYYENYREFEPAINSVKAIGGSLAAKALDLQVKLLEASREADSDSDELPEISIVSESKHETNISSEAIKSMTSNQVKRFIVAAATRTSPKLEIIDVFNRVYSVFEDLRKLLLDYEKDMWTLVEAISDSDEEGAYHKHYFVIKESGVRLDITGFPEDIVVIITSILEANPDMDPDECLEMAKSRWYELHENDDDTEDEE